jgi:hypothetical protein
VRRLLDMLRDDVSYDDIRYHIEVLRKIDRGVEAAERGDFISDEDLALLTTRIDFSSRR